MEKLGAGAEAVADLTSRIEPRIASLEDKVDSLQGKLVEAIGILMTVQISSEPADAMETTRNCSPTPHFFALPQSMGMLKTMNRQRRRTMNKTV